MPCQVDPRGASTVGNPTWVPPEQPYPSSFRKHTSASAGPSALWRLPAQLVAGVLGPSPVLERCAGRASLSAVAGAHHDRHRHRPRGAGGWRKSGTPLALVRQRRLSPSRASSLVASRECQQCPGSSCAKRTAQPGGIAGATLAASTCGPWLGRVGNGWRSSGRDSVLRSAPHRLECMSWTRRRQLSPEVSTSGSWGGSCVDGTL